MSESRGTPGCVSSRSADDCALRGVAAAFALALAAKALAFAFALAAVALGLRFWTGGALTTSLIGTVERIRMHAGADMYTWRRATYGSYRTESGDTQAWNPR